MALAEGGVAAGVCCFIAIGVYLYWVQGPVRARERRKVKVQALVAAMTCVGGAACRPSQL